MFLPILNAWPSIDNRGSGQFTLLFLLLQLFS
jgi:hypothetical protein